MSVEQRLLIVLALVLAAAVLGWAWKTKAGKARSVEPGQQIVLSEIAAMKNGRPVTRFGEKVTFLQFSSEMCSSCKQTAKQFGELEKLHPEMLHIEVDVTNRLDLAKKFNILQTPTTLVLDSKGRITSRIGGLAKPQTINDELESFHI